MTTDKTGDWISVEDHLPELLQVVLGWTKAGELGVFARDDRGGDGWVWARQAFSWNLADADGLEVDDDFDLTHWTPLPLGPEA